METAIPESARALARAVKPQCCHTMETGRRCKRVASPGEQYCHCHLQFRERGADWPVRVPLMEDATSIRFVISEVLMAMAFGTLPAANASAMLRGCRMALELLEFERKWKEKEPEARAEEMAPGEGVAEAVAETSGGTEMETAWEPEKHPEVVSSRPPMLGDLEAEWDRGMRQTERAMQRNLGMNSGLRGQAWLERRNRGIVVPHPAADRAVGIRGERDWGA